MTEVHLLANDIEGSIKMQQYLCNITWRNGTLVMDEPESVGGKDLGPDPYTTLLASLAGCTLSTLRMYIDRKGWNVPEITVRMNLWQDKTGALTTFIKRDIHFQNDIPAEQKERLQEIAKKCPVSKILENNIIINTTV